MPRILLVEGPEPDRDLLWAFFNGVRYEADLVVSVEDALAAFEQYHHELVITDLRPPRGDGFEIAREIHRMSERLTPILFLSGTATEEEVLREADVFLQAIGMRRKPIYLVDLVYKIRDWLALPDEENFLELMERLEPGDAGLGVLDDLLRKPGDLSRVPLGRVMYAMFETKRTGRLTVATDAGKIHLYTWRGSIVYMESDRPEDSLIQSLRRQGVLTAPLPAEDQARTLDEQIGLLLATRSIEPHRLPDALRQLLVDVLDTMVSTRSGVFRLEPADPPGRFEVAYHPLQLLLELHRQEVERLDDPLAIHGSSELVVRLPLGLDMSRWSLPAVEMKMVDRLRSMVGRPVVLLDLLRVYGEGERSAELRLRAFLDLLETLGYVDYRPPVFSEKERNVYRELLQEAYRIRNLNHFRLLRVRATDGPDKLKGVFHDASRRYHPDRFFNSPKRVGDLAGHIMAQYHEAYETLSNETSRKRYIAALDDRALKRAGVSDKDLHDPARASIMWKEAERYLKASKWTEAGQFIDEAVRFDSSRAVYQAARAWILYNQAPRKNREVALTTLRKALDVDNNCDRAHYYMGVIAKQDGDEAKAELYFSRAVTANSGNVDAKRELRLLQKRTSGREEGSSNNSGLLSGLFRRKK